MQVPALHLAYDLSILSLVRAASRVGYLRIAVHLHAEANVEVPGLEALHDHVPWKDVESVLLALGDDIGDGTSVEQQQVVHRLGLLQLKCSSSSSMKQGILSEDITSCFFSSSRR